VALATVCRVEIHLCPWAKFEINWFWVRFKSTCW